jgi:hypothetical protein
VLVAPAVTYEGGLLVRRPVYAGVFVATPDGKLRRLDPEQAAADRLVASAGRLYPEQLARRVTDSYQYKLGIINRLFTHREQFEVGDSDAANSQPYPQDIDGLDPQWVTAPKPTRNSEGPVRAGPTAVPGQRGSQRANRVALSVIVDAQTQQVTASFDADGAGDRALIAYLGGRGLDPEARLDAGVGYDPGDEVSDDADTDDEPLPLGDGAQDTLRRLLAQNRSEQRDADGRLEDLRAQERDLRRLLDSAEERY